jgi:hypothetical protein
MGVDDLLDADSGDRVPVHAAGGGLRDGVVVGCEQETAGVIQIDRKLALAIALEFVATGAGKEAQHGEIGSSFDFGETLLDEGGPARTVQRDEKSRRGQPFFEFPVSEGNLRGPKKARKV